jgi:hypothetical protein
MGGQKESRLRWLERRRERRRLKRQARGDSPQRLEEHHTPKRDAMDMWLKSGGVDRESRFKR